MSKYLYCTTAMMKYGNNFRLLFIVCLLNSVVYPQNTPAPPTNLQITNITQTSIDLTWIDASNNETGFHVYRSATGEVSSFILIGGDLPAGTESYEDTGPLAISQRYYYEIRAFNAVGESEPATANKATLAVLPGTPILRKASYHSIKTITNVGANSDGVEMAIQVEGNQFLKSSKYVQSDGTLGDTAVWKTFDGWGDTGGVKVQGLYPGTEYSFRLKARNPDSVEVFGFGLEALTSTTPAKIIDEDHPPLFEQFTNTSVFPPEGWTIEDVRGDGNYPNAVGTFGQWHLSTTNLYSAGGSARYFCWDYPAQIPGAPGGTPKCINPITGEEDSCPADDYLYTLPLKLTGEKNYLISFWYRTVQGRPHNVAVVLARRPYRTAIIDTITDRSYDTPGGYFQENILFSPRSPGVYYIGFWEHTPVNMVTFRLEDVLIREMPSSAVNLWSKDVVQRSPYPELGYSTRTTKNITNDDEENKELNVREFDIQERAFAPATKSVSHPYLVNTSVTASGIHAENIVINLGGPVTNAQWTIQWKPGVNEPTQIAHGVDLAATESTSVPLEYAPPRIGTFYTTAAIDFPNDLDQLNDTIKKHLFSFPDTYTVLDYDSAGNKPPSRTSLVGANPLAVAVQFTVPESTMLRVAGLYTYYKNTRAAGNAINESLTVKIHTAGPDTTYKRFNGVDTFTVTRPTIGPTVYTKKFGGKDYLHHSGSFGQEFFLPLDESGFAFASGDDFFLSIRFGVGSSSPMGFTDQFQGQVHSPAYYRSWSSVNGGNTWLTSASLDSSAWFIKAIVQPLDSIGMIAPPLQLSGRYRDATPAQFELKQNYPNPFNTQTVIGFSLITVSNVTLQVYDIYGREVATLIHSEAMDEGNHTIEWNAGKFPSGMYFYRLVVMHPDGAALRYTETKKFVLMK